MSRVSWSLQRRLAEIFEAEVGPFSTLELAARFYRVEAGETTDAQLSSVRRALNALVRKGVLIRHRGYHDRVAGRREFSDQDHLTAMRVAASDMRATVLRSRTLIEQTRAMLREIS
jgi:Fe2+ or Zn2+ uptake regulation protein